MAAMPVLLLLQLLFAVLIGAQLLTPDQPVADTPVGVSLLEGVVTAVMGLVLAALGASVLSEFYRRIMRLEIKGA
jgi:hypothetical protein